MPSHNQKTVDSLTSLSAKGTSGTENLKSIFSTSPIHAGIITREERLQYFQSLISNGDTDGGHTFGSFTFNYLQNGAPAYDDVDGKVGGGAGDPHSAKIPNPASPGAGNGIDPTKIPEGPEGFLNSHPTQFGSGPGSDLSPSDSSNDISSHTLRDYDMGIRSKTT